MIYEKPKLITVQVLETLIRNKYPDFHSHIKSLITYELKMSAEWVFCVKLMAVMNINSDEHVTWADVYDYVIENDHLIGIWML